MQSFRLRNPSGNKIRTLSLPAIQMEKEYCYLHNECVFCNSLENGESSISINEYWIWMAEIVHCIVWSLISECFCCRWDRQLWFHFICQLDGFQTICFALVFHYEWAKMRWAKRFKLIFLSYSKCHVFQTVKESINHVHCTSCTHLHQTLSFLLNTKTIE